MPRGGVRPFPPELGNMVPRGGPTLPSESRNGGTVAHHPRQRNATLCDRVSHHNIFYFMYLFIKFITEPHPHLWRGISAEKPEDFSSSITITY
jgi:hypothetical protein